MTDRLRERDFVQRCLFQFAGAELSQIFATKLDIDSSESIDPGIPCWNRKGR
jgi:hypothetical protein